MATDSGTLLEFLDRRGSVVGAITIAPRRGAGLWVLTDSEAAEAGEAQVQVVEQATYEFRLRAPVGTRLEPAGLIQLSAFNALESETRTGTLDTGSNAGRLVLSLVDVESRVLGTVELEVRSSRLTYRSEYRAMVDDIARFSGDLLLDVAAPTSTPHAPSYDGDPSLVTQAFYLLQLLRSEPFEAAVARILAAPITSISDEITETTAYRRIDPSRIAPSFASRDRVQVPRSHPLRNRAAGAEITTWPRAMHAPSRVPTRDTPENRFVRWILGSFAQTADDLSSRLRDTGSTRAADELAAAGAQAQAWRDDGALREVGETWQTPIATPAMQRRPGYRDVYRAWLGFNSTARIRWDGLEDAFAANRRNLAELYEYWVFLQLLAITRDIFDLEPARDLVVPTAQGLRVQLRRGQAVQVSGKAYGERRLRVALTYNRGFGPSPDRHAPGSWTQGMRPDYTLSFWPESLTQTDAERFDLAVHVHFDAKYKADDLTALFGDREVSEADEDPVTLAPKRADLLKMHAYRDAIRRSEGAYVIYPGTQDQHKRWVGYRELLPGLGAFPLRPEPEGAEGLEELRQFIVDAAALLSDRAAARERLSYARYAADLEAVTYPVSLQMPEVDPTSGVRIPPPVDGSASVVTVTAEQAAWIRSHGRLPIRLQVPAQLSDAGPLGVRYALLQDANGAPLGQFIVSPSNSRIAQGLELFAVGYPDVEGAALYVIHIGRS